MHIHSFIVLISPKVPIYSWLTSQRRKHVLHESENIFIESVDQKNLLHLCLMPTYICLQSQTLEDPVYKIDTTKQSQRVLSQASLLGIWGLHSGNTVMLIISNYSAESEHRWMMGCHNYLICLQAQMILHRIKGSHVGLSAGGILKLNSDTIATVSVELHSTVEFND